METAFVLAKIFVLTMAIGGPIGLICAALLPFLPLDGEQTDDMGPP